MHHDLICVSIESPLRAGPNHDDQRLLLRNVEYAKLACQDSIMRGESPYASHLFFPQFMNEADMSARIAALAMSHAWRIRSDLIAFYIDFGMSSGMKDAEALALHNGIPTERRQISAEAMAALEEMLENDEHGQLVASSTARSEQTGEDRQSVEILPGEEMAQDAGSKGDSEAA